MSRLLLVRHGATELTTNMRFQGQINTELNAEGYKQVEKLRDRLTTEKIDQIYCSDLKRAMATAEVINSRHKADITACPELREISYGEVEGMAYDDIRRLHPDVADCCVNWSTQLKFPGGESFSEFTKRVNQFTEELNKHTPEQNILIVAHGGTLRVVLCQLLGLELWRWRQFQINVASLSIVEKRSDIAILNLFNDTSHLKI
jgi:alpha-ribazole phosphatase